ncbi:Wadjet anti-phage system protein JetD domain-containing protein [uncultured Gilvimarinus sp.]|uniref:Wadjet anti-phage system protein JetD domain-containing protein n=1 Tax=uncultured Gilvimarinus sp. TaxID=1689143 RepID=UPI0030DC6C60
MTQSKSSVPTKKSLPVWWSSELLPNRLLHKFMDQLDAGRRPYVKVTPKTVPELYDFQGQDVEFLWALLNDLDREYHMLTIKRARVNPQQEPYDNAQIYFLPDKEPLVREWLNRPALDPYALTWAHELKRQQHKFEDGGAALVGRHVRVKGMSAAQVVRAFAVLGQELQRPVTLRALSARCFAGDSKALESYELLVRALYPSLSQQLQARPVMLVVHLGQPLAHILFVENQDTFLALAQADLPGITLVYSAGFRGSATRVREPGQVVFSYLNPDADTAGFKRAWFDGEASSLRVSFWGDLDYAGMAILKALRQSFAQLEAWQPGYEPLLARLHAGLGHTQASGVKNPQPDPGLTGCRYADTTLLPAIRQTQSYVDQEAASLCELQC